MTKTAAVFYNSRDTNLDGLTEVQNLFQKIDITTNIVPLDCDDIETSIQKVKVAAKENSFLIADSLTAFFLLYETNSNARILINPIMKPSESLYYKNLELSTIYRKMEDFIDSYRDAEIRSVTYGIFEHSNKENLDADGKLFLNNYGRKFNKKIDNYCFSDRITGIQKALEYFEYMAKLRRQEVINV